jgi:hypothetical protein
MAGPSVTYTFSNSTTADATQVNQNFTDLINGATDGTKDYSISALTCAGNATFNGNVTLGNASGDDITFTGSLASSIPIKTNFAFDIGSSTLGLRYLYLGSDNAAAYTIKLTAPTLAASYTLTLPTAVPSASNSVIEFTTGGVGSFRALKTPTVQKFTSGSSTYNTPSGVKWIRVRMVGGGGGGGGSGSASYGQGGTGGNTTFGTTLLEANGGTGGQTPLEAASGGAGGSASLGSGPIGTAISGAQGNSATFASLETFAIGGAGGQSPLGGAGAQGYATGRAGVSNSGSGGGGGGGSGTNVYGGNGGGAGGFVEAIILSPSSSYAYAVGAGGAAGTAGTNGAAGGAGGSGYIEVTEYYQ